MASDDVAADAVEIPGQRQARLSRFATHHWLELEIAADDFDNPRHEWRRLFSELLGTFLLVMVGAGGGVINAQSHGAISRSAAVTAPGLMVMAIILFMGTVSGAHLNPAVSLGFAVRGDFPWRRVPGYIVVQLAGATLACLTLWAIFGKIGMLGATEPGPGIDNWQAMLIEMILTAGLLSTILGTASKAQNVGPLSALAVAGYIALAGLWSSPVSGASMNPARSFGPDAALGDFSHYWVYVAGPLLGAAIAVGAAWILRGAGDAGGAAAAQGAIGALRVREVEDAGEAGPAS
jgi:aquaporin Z